MTDSADVLTQSGGFPHPDVEPFRGVLAATVCLTVAGLGASPVSAGPQTKDLERKKETVRKREGSCATPSAPPGHRGPAGQAAGADRRRPRAKQSEAEAARLAADEATAAADRVSAEVAELKQVLESRKATFNRRAVQAYMGGEGRPLDDLSVAGRAPVHAQGLLRRGPPVGADAEGLPRRRRRPG